MLKTDNYELNIAQGTDIVNPLVMDNPNYQKIDKVMKDNEIRGVGTATELKTGSIHAITVPAQYTTFKFVATSDFIAGETFTLNGKQVTGYTTNQQPLATNAYRIGATVLCSYIDRTSTITLYTIAPAGIAEDSKALEGNPASYFAVRGDINQTLEQVNITATSRGTLAQKAQEKADKIAAREVEYTLTTNQNGEIYLTSLSQYIPPERILQAVVIGEPYGGFFIVRETNLLLMQRSTTSPAIALPNRTVKLKIKYLEY